MNLALLYKTKQFFFVLIKISIVVAAFYFIYNKLVNNTPIIFSSFIAYLKENHVFSLKNMSILIILSLINWFFEILKWQNLVSPVKTLSFKNAASQSLGALTASLFTPNRIGEYGAKAMYYTQKFRPRVMLINLLSNTLQMAVTTILGVIGFVLYIEKYNPDINYYKLIKFGILVVITLSLICLGLIKSNFKIKGFSFLKMKMFFIWYPKIKLIEGAFFSLLRYFIFSFQFYFLLQIFKVNLGYFDAMIIISTMYLIASIIPSIFIFDVVIKSSVGVYLFSLVGVHELLVLCIITCMWILNFVFPSLLGSYYVLSFKLPKKYKNI